MQQTTIAISGMSYGGCRFMNNGQVCAAVERVYVERSVDISTATLRLSMDLELSTPVEMRLPLLWIAILHILQGYHAGVTDGPGR